MADEKISTLPAAVSAAAANQLEANQSGVSRRVTIEQVLNALSPFIVLAADGSASFANNLIGFAVDGSSIFSNGNITFSIDGSANFAGALITFTADGSANFPNSAINADGSASFANNSIAFATDGTATFASVSASEASFGSGNFTANVSGIQFGSGALAFDAGGIVTTQLVVNNDVVITDTSKGVILKASDNSLWRLKVSDLGVLSTEAV